MYLRTTEAITNFVGIQYGGDMRMMVKHGTEKTFTKPMIPRSKDTTPKLMEKYKTELRIFHREKKDYQDDKAKAFVIIFLTIAPLGGIEYLQSHLGTIEHLQFHLHFHLLQLLIFGFHASSSFGDNHSDSGHIHYNSSNESAQVAAHFAVCTGRKLSPLIHSCCRPCVHHLGDPGNATTRLECRLTTLGTDQRARSYSDPTISMSQIALCPLRPGRSYLNTYLLRCFCLHLRRLLQLSQDRTCPIAPQ
jgi:hypothetical protein